GEIITYLPTGAGADADSIELDILMASGSKLEEVSRALANSGVDLEEIPRRAEGAAAVAAPSLVPAISLLDRPSEEHASSIAPGRSKIRSVPAKGDITSLRSVAQTVRVDIHKLDHLMNIVGELAIVRTSLARLVERLRLAHIERELVGDVQRLQRT